jgi:serine/threonine-protein kinase
MPNVGDIVAGRYVLERLLAVGGMGHVYVARDRASSAPVALKILSPGSASEENVVRFFREARAASGLKSEHVVRVFDVGHGNSVDLPYIVMELLDGKDIRHRIRQGLMAIHEAVQLGLELCDALGEAHAQGIVHRDVKPANLVRTSHPVRGTIVKVLDFGVSKMADETVDVTNTGATIGSPAYMPPEQVRSGKTVDHRADIWSVGVVLYELLSGVSPFQRDHVASTLLAVVSEEPVPLVDRRPDLPPALSDVIMRCLRKQKTDRYESMGALAVDLARFAQSDSQASSWPSPSWPSLRPISFPSIRTEALITYDLDATSARRRSRARDWAAALASALVVLLALVKYGTTQPGATLHSSARSMAPEAETTTLDAAPDWTAAPVSVSDVRTGPPPSAIREVAARPPSLVGRGSLKHAKTHVTPTPVAPAGTADAPPASTSDMFHSRY